MGVEVKVKSSDAEVIATGSSFTYNGNPLSVELHNIGSEGDCVSVVFEFVEDKEQQSTRIKRRDATNDNGFVATFELINFNEPLGAGIVSPIVFATNKQGMELSLSFYTWSFENRKTKRVAYTIFRRKVSGDVNG